MNFAKNIKKCEFLTKCPIESYAYYDLWGNRHLIYSATDYNKLVNILSLRILGIKLEYYSS